MRYRPWLVASLAAFTLVSCASPPKPSAEEVTRTWEETIQEWGACQRQHAESLEAEERDEYLGRHMEIMANLHLLNMVTLLHAVSDDEWHGVVRIDGEIRTGATATVRLSTCPPGRRFALYSAPDLAHPQHHPSGNSDYWILDLGRQKLEAVGTIDARGEAAVTVAFPADPALVGSFRGYQATILKEGAEAGGATVGFTLAHGRRLR